MGADDLDIFKKIVFSIPSLRYQIPGILLLSVVYSATMYVSFQLFTEINVGAWVIPYIAIFLFAIPVYVSTEVLHRVLPQYPRKWGMFLGGVNQLLLFMYTLILSGADNLQSAWNIIWLGLITLYLVYVFVLIVSVGISNLKRILAVSAVHPLVVFGLFHFFLGRFLEIPRETYVFSLGSVLMASGFLLVLFYITEYLLGMNANVSAFELTSGLLRKDREALDIGVESRPWVQTFRVEDGEEFTAVAPWVHPGPLGGFGGGELSRYLIDDLNRGEKGFFFHVPCTHRDDLSDPEDVSKISEAVQNPETSSEASRLISRSYRGIKLFGRAFGDQKIVFMEMERFDDYDSSIVSSVIDMQETMVVDLHNHDFHDGPEAVMDYGSVEARKLQEAIQDFIAELDELEQHDYSAGSAVSSNGKSVMALAEEVDGQKVLTFGIDTNGTSEDVKALAASMESRFDEVLLFSTDTHASVHELANYTTQDTDKLSDVIDEAASRVETASIGLGAEKAESLKLLKMDYQGLTYSINILIRLLPLALVVFYLLLWLWFF